MLRPAIHPGEILADDLIELGVTPSELSRQIIVPANRLSQIMAAAGSPATQRCASAIGSE